MYENLSDPHAQISGLWRIRNCRSCSIFWLDPRPTANEIPNLYDSYPTHRLPAETGGGGIFNNFKEGLRRGVFHRFHRYPQKKLRKLSFHVGWFLGSTGFYRRRFSRTIHWLNHKNGHCLLDVGCGNGSFLRRMKQLGWEVEGIEPDSRACDVVSQALNVPVHNMPAEEMHKLQKQFDIITLSHVIEHLVDPTFVLQSCFKLLFPGGILSIITPNAGSRGHKLFGPAWRGLEVPRHLQLFTIESLSRLLEGAGFNLLWIRSSTVFDRNIYSESRHLKKKLTDEVQITLAPDNVAALIEGKRGEEIVACAQRPS